MEYEDYIPEILKNIKNLQCNSGIITPYSMPVDYFGNLTERILFALTENKETPSQAQDTFLENGFDRETRIGLYKNSLSSTAIQDIPNGPFIAPPSYFENLPKQILSKIEKQPPKIFYLNTWYKIAVVAALVGIITFWGIGYFKSHTGNMQYASPAVAIQKISSKELSHFIEDENSNASLSPEDKNDDDTNQLFKNISSNELKNFLNESGVDNAPDASLN